ncbi:protein Fe65 isoform X1 [Vespula maculifrons]|uniref:Protein Fe65 isoform X1 n=1 Tax=Vespula maculifrons TaxID=7453 RepID=A0ABD2BP74_VESMC
MSGPIKSTKSKMDDRVEEVGRCGEKWCGYSSEGVTESALVDDTLNGNPRPSSPSSSPPSTSTSSSILPPRSSLLQQTGSTVNAADKSATRMYCFS